MTIERGAIKLDRVCTIDEANDVVSPVQLSREKHNKLTYVLFREEKNRAK